MTESQYEGICKYTRDNRYMLIMTMLVAGLFILVLGAIGFTNAHRVEKLEESLKGMGTTPHISLPRSCEDVEAKLKSQEKIIGDQRGYIADLIGRIQELEK